MEQQQAHHGVWMSNSEGPPAQFLLNYGKRHPHPRAYTEFPAFQHDINTDINLYIRVWRERGSLQLLLAIGQL